MKLKTTISNYITGTNYHQSATNKIKMSITLLKMPYNKPDSSQAIHHHFSTNKPDSTHKNVKKWYSSNARDNHHHYLPNKTTISKRYTPYTMSKYINQSTTTARLTATNKDITKQYKSPFYKPQPPTLLIATQTYITLVIDR